MIEQSEVRDRLMILFRKHPHYLVFMAKDIGIHFNTLNNFLKKGKDVEYVPLIKILNYVEKKEKEQCSENQ